MLNKQITVYIVKSVAAIEAEKANLEAIKAAKGTDAEPELVAVPASPEAIYTTRRLANEAVELLTSFGLDVAVWDVKRTVKLA